MQSIFITGDKHGEISGFSSRYYLNYKDELRNSNKDENFIIVCGDFGFIWRQKEDAEEKYDLEIINNKPWTTLFVDGNHENFNRLNSEFEVVDFKGGKAHKIRDNIYHLMRGEIYEILGLKFFAFGGARSHDISDGILDYNDEDWRNKARQLDKQGKHMYRVKGLSWWEEELPTKEEMNYGLANFRKHNREVDYIITHQPPENIILRTSASELDFNEFTSYLENINNSIKFKKWFSGHIHLDHEFDGWHRSLYYDWERVV